MNDDALPVPGFESAYRIWPRRREDGSDVVNASGLGLKSHAVKGYHYVKLSEPGGGKRALSVSRLRALAFLGQPPSRECVVAHVDGDSLNDDVCNLRWSSRSEALVGRARRPSEPLVPLQVEDDEEFRRVGTAVYVSNKGRVAKRVGDGFVRAHPPKGAYPKVWRNGKPVALHRAAFEAWHRPLEPGEVVDHVDEDTRNVAPHNLRAATTAENNRFARLCRYEVRREGVVRIVAGRPPRGSGTVTKLGRWHHVVDDDDDAN